MYGEQHCQSMQGETSPEDRLMAPRESAAMPDILPVKDRCVCDVWQMLGSGRCIPSTGNLDSCR